MIHRNKKSYICLFFILLVGACDKPVTRIEKEKAEYSFTFDIESHDVAHTANTYTKYVCRQRCCKQSSFMVSRRIKLQETGNKGRIAKEVIPRRILAGAYLWSSETWLCTTRLRKCRLH